VSMDGLHTIAAYAVAGAALITAHKCHKCDSLKPLLVIMQKVGACEGWLGAGTPPLTCLPEA
jgi:hypothetical protein